jgi:hypothetical protein
MTGNLWEWCEDWRGPYDGAPQVDPRGPDTGRERVLRGGPWNRGAACCRSAYRHSTAQTDRGARRDLGCRVCLTAIPRRAPEAPKAGDWQSLFDGKTLRGWELVEQFGSKASVREGALILEGTPSWNAISWTDDVPSEEYEIEYEAMRIEGREDFGTLAFPISGATQCMLQIGAWGGQVVGLSAFDRADCRSNTTARRMPFENNRWYRIRLRVSRERVQAWIGPDKLVDVPRAGHEFAPPSDRLRAIKPFGFCSRATIAALRNIRLRRLD